MRPSATPVERFRGWFEAPIAKLKELPEGDGAFAALMIALPLYERSIIAGLKLAELPAGEDEIRAAMSADLGLDDRDRATFWAMFRVGFMHQAMVSSGTTKWLVSHRFGEIPEFRTVNGDRCLCIDPWKFADRVVATFLSDPRRFTVSVSFPLADVFSLSANAVLPSK